MYPPTLSEKAKGKQRAVEPPLPTTAGPANSTPAPPPEPTSRDLVVRFTEGAPDLTIRLDKKDSVRDVKKYVRLPAATPERPAARY